jgi:hypothetical protein
MATLVLTTIGTIVGGPIGGAIGSLLGQQIDQRLFAPKGRQGPRLNDLSLQTSTYGQAIPKLFGSMRVAGSVIWATDLREEQHRSGGGKGAPKTTTYSYSASFAVALSARPIRAVHRIWADGKLLRGAAGDWKSETGFRLYLGDEEQDIDPLIASAEGGGTPAYRGIAYALFEDFQLADYGNHIPSLTFEVEADEGPVSVGAIAAALGDGAIGGDTSASVGGYAASGDSVRGALEALASIVPVTMLDDGVVLALSDDPPAPIEIGVDEAGAAADGKRVARLDVERRAAGTLPDEIAIAYYEPSRDYQAGLQRARRGGPGRLVDRLELPAALDPGEAKSAAERRLATLWSERAQATLRLPWRRMALRPGAHLSLRGVGGVWRIAGWTLDRMVTELKLVAVSAGGVGSIASAGRATPGADRAHGPTVVHLLDLPPLDDAPATMPRLWVAAAGEQAGWRRAELTVSRDGGASWSPIGTTVAPAVIGETLGALGAGDASLFDRRSSVDIELLHDDMWLESRDDDALIAGANLAMVGDELLQFGDAEQIGARRYRLSRLLRGRRGSEWAMAGHAAGERFILVESAALLGFDLPVAAIGGTVMVLAAGVGDGGSPAETETALVARALRPPPPSHIRAERLGDGTIRIGWTRRSRIGWAWLDGSDAPLGEEGERYGLTLTPSTDLSRTVDLIAPGYDYSPSAQDADGSAGAASIVVTVAQLGSIASSLPASSASFTL